VSGGGSEHYEKILKIPIFRAEGDADLIDFNRFGKVVSRRAGIIRLIDFPQTSGFFEKHSGGDNSFKAHSLCMTT